MNPQCDDNVVKMQELLNKKKEALKIIYNLTLKQKNDIDTNEGANLEKYIDDKQIEIDKIDNIDKGFSMIFEDLKKRLNIESMEELDTGNYSDFKIIKEQIKGLMEIAHKTMALERENKDALEILIDNVKNDIKQVSLGKKSISAYEKQSTNTDGIYIDKKK